MAHFQDVTPFIDEMRNIKTPQEIEVLRRNGKLSAEGKSRSDRARASGNVSVSNRSARQRILHGPRRARRRLPRHRQLRERTSTRCHYFSDRHKIEANQLVVLDFAASLDHMTMDITRTFNISGKFTPGASQVVRRRNSKHRRPRSRLLTPGHTYEEASAAGKAVLRQGWEWAINGADFPAISSASRRTT